MTADDKPLHVKVAEAIGWADLRDTHGAIMLPGEPNMWIGKPPEWDRKSEISNIDFVSRIVTLRVDLRTVDRYDQDWAATGPLVDRFEITAHRTLAAESELRFVAFLPFSDLIVGSDAYGMDGYAHHFEYGPTRLIAVCNLIVSLHRDGHLVGGALTV